MGDDLKAWVQETMARVLMMDIGQVPTHPPTLLSPLLSFHFPHPATHLPTQAEELATCVLGMPCGSRKEEGEVR